MTAPLLGRTLTSVVGWARELEEADAVIRTPLALSRRVGVVAVEGGSGTTTVAAALTSLLVRRRRGAVLAVDAGGGGLRERLDDTGTAERPGLVDLSRPDEPWPAPVRRWSAEVAPVARAYDLVVTDWGARPWAADLPDAATAGHVAVLVARADRRAALEAAAGSALLADLGGVRSLLVLVRAEPTPDRVAARLARQLGIPVLTVGHDEALRTGSAPGARPDARTRADLIRLARAVVEQAARSVQPARDEE